MTISSIRPSFSVVSAPVSGVPSRPVPVNEALRLLSRVPGAQVMVADTSQNIQRNWNSLNSITNNLTSVAVTDA